MTFPNLESEKDSAYTEHELYSLPAALLAGGDEWRACLALHPGTAGG